MDTQVLGTERLKQEATKSQLKTKTKGDEVAKKLPYEIWLKVLNYDVFELIHVNKFFQTLIKNNRNNICYNIIKNQNLITIYEDAYTIYKFYRKYTSDEKFKHHLIDDVSLCEVVENRNMKIVRFLLDNFPDTYDKRFGYNDTVIHAICNNNLEVVQYFCENYLDDILNKNRLTHFIQIAINYDNVSIFRYLLDFHNNKYTTEAEIVLAYSFMLKEALKRLRLKIIKHLIKPHSTISLDLLMIPKCSHDFNDNRYEEYIRYILSSELTIS
jgi:hypothetical protein